MFDPPDNSLSQEGLKDLGVIMTKIDPENVPIEVCSPFVAGFSCSN